jgi:hypothetical protein
MRSSAFLLLALAWPLACTAFCPAPLALPLSCSSPTRACRQAASPMMMSQVVPNNNRGRMRKAFRGRLPSLADVKIRPPQLNFCLGNFNVGSSSVLEVSGTVWPF